MVEYKSQLDLIFGALSDATRRDILRRVESEDLNVTDIAQSYHMSLAAVSKHLKILEKAGLIVKYRYGKQHFARLAPGAIKQAAEHLRPYGKYRNDKLDSLEFYLANN